MYLVAPCFGDQSACRSTKALEVCMCMCSIVFYSLIIIINIYIEERIIEFYLFLYNVVVMHSCATHTAQKPQIRVFWSLLVLPAHQNDNQSHQKCHQHTIPHTSSLNARSSRLLMPSSLHLKQWARYAVLRLKLLVIVTPKHRQSPQT